MKISDELKKQAINAKSAEELLKIAEENHIEITPEEAEKYYASLHTEGQLSDTELDNVAGGCDPKKYKAVCPRCGLTDFYQEISNNGNYYCNHCHKTFKTPRYI